VSRLETERLVSDLRRLKIAISAIVVNAMTLGPRRCGRCRQTAALERIEIAALGGLCRAASRGSVIIQTALAAPPPRGLAALEEWATQWIPAVLPTTSSASSRLR